MKNLILALSLFFFVQGAFAADTKKDQAAKTQMNMAQMGKIDNETLNIEPKKKENVDLVNKDHGIKVNVSCKLVDGREIKQGETGYDECLQRARPQQGQNQGPAADIKVNFGN